MTLLVNFFICSDVKWNKDPFLSVYLILIELLWQFSFNTFQQAFNLDHFHAEYDLNFSFWFDVQKIRFYIFCHSFYTHTWNIISMFQLSG